MYKNAEDAKTYGVDVNASWKITKELTIGGNYSYLDTKATVYNSAKGRFQNAIIDGMAHNKWNGYANYGHRFSPCYNLGVNLSTRGSSKRYYENDGNGKAFQIWRLNTTHDLGKSMVVEGVETEAQVEFLKEIGCTKLQGFYYSKPIPMSDLLKRYEE